MYFSENKTFTDPDYADYCAPFLGRAEKQLEQ